MDQDEVPSFVLDVAQPRGNTLAKAMATLDEVLARQLREFADALEKPQADSRKKAKA